MIAEDRRRQLIKLAYRSSDPELRRRALAHLHEAAYSKEFRKWVQGRRFRNPATGNDVAFSSLPSEEKSRVYQTWHGQRGREVVPGDGAPELDKDERKALLGHLEGLIGTLEEGKKKDHYTSVMQRFKETGEFSSADAKKLLRDGRDEWRLVQQGTRYVPGLPSLHKKLKQHARKKASFPAFTEPPMTSFARRMVRLAYTTSDVVLRRGILESLRIAAYPKEFLDAVKKQKFRNPTTNNQVQFVSLPGQMQAQIYQQWKQSQQDAETGLENVAPGPEVMQSSREAVYGFLPQRVDSLEDAKKLQAQGLPWRMSAVAGSQYQGKFKFWEVRGDGDKIELRFGGNYPGAAKPQTKELKSVEDAWKRFQGKLKKGYDSGIGANWAMSFSGGPMGMDADKLWETLEQKHGKNPKEMAEAVKSALMSLTQLDAWSPGNWDSVHETSDGLVAKWKEYQAKGGKTEKKPEPKGPEPKGPEMVDLTSQVMQKLKEMGPKPKEPEKAEPKPKPKPKKKPTFGQARDAAFQALEDAGWSVKKSLKTPKAEREIDGNKVVLTFKPQAVYMEIKGKSSHPLSLHVDLRDVDPKEWESTLADEAKKMLKLEEEVSAPPPAPPKPEKAEAPKPVPAEPEKPEKAEAPKAKGKHKDRKELRAKPKKKMTAKVTVRPDLEALLLPEGMPEQQKAQAKKQLESATYQLLSSLRDNAQHAIDDPKGAYAAALGKHGYTPEGIKKMHAALSKALTPVLGKKYHPDVLQVANQYDLESDDADELAKFKKGKPAIGKKLTPQELFNRFMAKAKPETKERMQGMNLNDFMAMYAAIMADEDEEGLDAPGKKAARLPQEPHRVMQDALDEGIIAEDEEVEGLTIFDAPVTKKKARMSDEDRTLVRMAAATTNPDLRRRLLGLVRRPA